MKYQGSEAIAKVDRRLALSFGALILILMLTVAGVAVQLFSQLNKKEEDRLASVIAMTLDQAIGKVSFSGKYHTRLLLEEMKEKVPELAFISIETKGGKIIAHSDPSMNDKQMDGASEAETRAKTLLKDTTLVGECQHEGRSVKEVILPYRGGGAGEAVGIIRIGLNSEQVRKGQKANVLMLLGLIAILSMAAIWAVLLMSQHFGGKVRALAIQLQGMADSVPGVIYQFQLESGGKLQASFVSQSSETLFGLKPSPPERFMDDFKTRLAPECRTPFESSLKEAAAKLSAWDFEGRFRKNGGEELFFHFIAQTVRQEDGGGAVFSGVLLDITQRKKAEQELKSSQERFANICNLSPIMIAIATKEEGRIMEANPAFALQTGYTREEFIGRNVLDLGLYADPEDRNLMLRKVEKDGYLHDFELKMRTKPGAVRICLLSIAPLAYDGKPCLLSLIHDISGRKEMEESLRRSRNMIENIMNSIPQAVFWKDRDGVYLGCNEVFAKVAGVEKARRIIGKTDLELPWTAKDAMDYREADRRAMDARAPLRHIIEEVQAADGKRIWVDTTKLPLFDEKGNVYGVLGVFEDITERKKAEDDKEKLQAQLTQAQKMESIGRLAGGVAHDFNNMLQAIMGYLFLIKEEAPPGSRLQNNLKEIQKAAERSADLTRQLLAFARRQTVAPKTLDLNECIGSMLKMLQRLIGENIQLDWSPKEGLWPVKMDPSQLDQLLANLTVNARDAIAGAGKVCIETRNIVVDEAYARENADCAPGSYVQLTVSDSGKGMDQETIAHIFEPFFTTKGPGKGTGLGLATVFGIVKQNGGFISVYSEPGLGSNFKICLPKSKDEGEEDGVDEIPPSEMKRPGGSETILLVEDEEQILSLGKEILTDCGYKVLAAGTPEAALKLAQEEPGKIHLLLSDVVMPGMNGKELRKRLEEIKPGLRSVFMSGYTADVIAHHGILDKGVDFLQKPFTMESLTEKVREVLDAKEQEG